MKSTFVLFLQHYYYKYYHHKTKSFFPLCKKLLIKWHLDNPQSKYHVENTYKITHVACHLLIISRAYLENKVALYFNTHPTLTFKNIMDGKYETS